MVVRFPLLSDSQPGLLLRPLCGCNCNDKSTPDSSRLYDAGRGMVHCDTIDSRTGRHAIIPLMPFCVYTGTILTDGSSMYSQGGVRSRRGRNGTRLKREIVSALYINSIYMYRTVRTLVHSTTKGHRVPHVYNIYPGPGIIHRCVRQQRNRCRCRRAAVT